MLFRKITATTLLSDSGKPVDLENDFIADARSRAGFSLIELLIIMVVVVAIVGIAMLNIRNILPGIHANTAAHQVAAAMREARQRAMSTNRDHQITFVGDDQIVVQRHCTAADTAPLPTGDPGCIAIGWNDLPSAINPSLTLGNQSHFMRNVAGLISPDGNTFESGNTAAVIDFTAPAPFVFTPEGFLVEGSNRDNVVNGTIYIGQQNAPDIVRAVTILGSVGRVRKWTGIRNGGLWVWRR